MINDFFGDKNLSSDSKSAAFNMFVGLGLQIPVSKSIPLYLETGLRYRRDWLEYNTVTTDETDFRIYRALSVGEDWANMLEIPIKVSYRLPTSDICSFDFALGPKVSYNFTPVEISKGGSYEIDKETGKQTNNHTIFSEGKKSPVIVEIEPSVTFNIRAFRVGLQGSIPVVTNGISNTSYVSATIGFSFKTGVWKSIGHGAMATGMVMSTLAEGYVNANAGYNEASTSDGGIGETSSDNPNAGSSWERMYYHWEKRAIEAYNSLNGQSGSSSTYMSRKKMLRNAQKEMRKARKKARESGINITPSEYENKSVGVR